METPPTAQDVLMWRATRCFTAGTAVLDSIVSSGRKRTNDVETTRVTALRPTGTICEVHAVRTHGIRWNVRREWVLHLRSGEIQRTIYGAAATRRIDRNSLSPPDTECTCRWVKKTRT